MSADVRPGSLRAYVLACRPPTLAAAFVPVAIGSACAFVAGGFRPGPALAALVGALLLQVGANFANDVFDYEKGADTEERLGPTRAVQAGLVSPRAMRVGMAIVFTGATALGAYLVLVAGWPVVVIGIASIACAIAYTGGPYPLGYHGLGDVFVMAFFGFVAVCGTAYVEAGHVPRLAWLAALPPGALATAILVVNNVRDRETDARVGKRTLAVRFGRRAVLGEYVALVLVAYAVPVVLLAQSAAGPPVLLPLLSAPLALVLVRRLVRTEGRALNPLLGQTARLLVVHGLLFALGLALSAR